MSNKLKRHLKVYVVVSFGIKKTKVKKTDKPEDNTRVEKVTFTRKSAENVKKHLEDKGLVVGILHKQVSDLEYLGVPPMGTVLNVGKHIIVKKLG